MDNKIKLLKKINVKLKKEFTFVKLKAQMTKNKIILEIFHNISKNKSSNLENKFYMLDGGIRDRIIRKTKNLLKLNNFTFTNIKNIFIIS